MLLGAGVMRNLNEFVTEKGGGVVFIAGPRFTPEAYRDTPLAALMPLEFDGASARSTDLGPRRRLAGSAHESWFGQPDDAAGGIPWSRRARFGATCRGCIGCSRSRN